MIGLIYGYYEGDSLSYLGMTCGPYTKESVLKARHRVHLYPSNTGRFDQALQEHPDKFDLRVLREVNGSTSASVT